MPILPRRVDLSDELPVRLKSALNSGKGTLINLSTGGAYVATRMLLLPQAQVRLIIVMPKVKRWLEVKAVVTWENRDPEHPTRLPVGYGLRFTKLPSDTAEVFEQLIHSANPETAPSEVADAQPELVRAAEEATGMAEELHIEGIEDPEDREDRDGPPYRLRAPALQSVVPDRKPGIYVLLYDRTQDARVGRADFDLRSTLEEFVGVYAYFYCEIIEDDSERFRRECELFHRLGGDHGQLDNHDHPEPPGAIEAHCPVCAA